MKPISPRRGISLFLLACAISSGWACAGENSEERWAKVTRGDLVQEVEVTGEMRATDSISVSPPPISSLWEYKIVYIIDEGEAVEPGTRLLEFDTESLTRLLEVAETDASRVQEELKRRLAETQLSAEDDRLGLAEAEATANRNRLKTDRSPEFLSGLEQKTALLDRELSDRELQFRKSRAKARAERDRADLAILSNRLESRRAEVLALKRDIHAMSVKSPRKGVVLHRANREGEKRKTGDSSWRGEAILEVVSLSNLYATGSVDEVFANQLAPGQPLSLRLDAYPDKAYAGKLKKLHQTVRREGGGAVIDLDIDLTSELRGNVRPGMRFRGKIETARFKDTLKVPIEAIFVEPNGPVLYVKQGGKPTPHRVVLGKRTDRFVEVKSGVAAGDLVLRNREESSENGEK
ncbi:MAG: efflux RND transporter periplasmic adaptor subunit [Polyangiaceae bacterium]|nr:efflux RND transporter periplasmic adaptor subunit [Polyangiaceae bacterium]